MMGFEPLVNQRLLPPTFPRYAKIIKREEMAAYFGKLIERIKAVCDVINTTNLHGILVNNNAYPKNYNRHLPKSGMSKVWPSGYSVVGYIYKILALILNRIIVGLTAQME